VGTAGRWSTAVILPNKAKKPCAWFWMETGTKGMSDCVACSELMEYVSILIRFIKHLDAGVKHLDAGVISLFVLY
jgi:hypothetical protein